MTTSNAYDGQFSTPLCTTKGPPSYPFKELGNVNDFIRVDQYLQHIATFAPATPGLENPDEPTLYLHAESDPVLTRTGLYAFERKWSTLPLPQVDYSTLAITKPAFSIFDGFVDTWSWYSVPTWPTAQGKANELTRDGKFINPAGNAAIYGPVTVSTSANSGSDTRVTSVGHGVTGDDQLVVVSGGASYIVLQTADYTVIDPDTIDVLNINLAAQLTEIMPSIRNYTPGVDRSRTQLTQTFYLPGVTAGISTGADIPVISPAFDDEVFIDLILSSATSYQTYDAEPLGHWLESPIFQQIKIEIDLSSL